MGETVREALFTELQESVRDAVDHRKGATVSRADRFRRPKKLKLAEIRSFRIKWGVNQLVFGKRLGGRECSCRAGLGARKASPSTALQRFSRRVDASKRPRSPTDSPHANSPIPKAASCERTHHRPPGHSARQRCSNVF